MFKKYMNCIYCGEIVAWRYIWDIGIGIIYESIDNREYMKRAIDIYPVNWRHIRKNCCSPSNMKGD